MIRLSAVPVRPTAGLVALGLLVGRLLLVRPGSPVAPVVLCYVCILVLAVAATPPRRSRSARLVAATAAGVAVAGWAFHIARPAGMQLATPAVLLPGVLAAVAEEALFRGLLFSWVEDHARAGVAIAASAAAFALVHLPFYGLTALPVDLGAGLFFSWQRWASDSWAPSAITHALINLGGMT